MPTEPTSNACRRPGCRFPRKRTWNPVLEKSKAQSCCSRWCLNWLRHAKQVTAKGGERQAQALIDALVVLDGRSSAEDRVYGVQIIDGRKWIVHATKTAKRECR